MYKSQLANRRTQMNKLPGTSADILAKTYKKSNNLFTEDKIDFERLQKVLGAISFTLSI